MKKSLLVLTAALSFGVAAAQTAAPASAPQVPALTDVPAGHWAKDAIDLLVSKGILLGYPDGTFRGTQNLTRYEAAVIIARLLDQVKGGEVTITDEETLTALQNAIQELAADLAALGVRVSDLEENAVSRDDFARLEERVEMLAAASGDAEALAGLTSQIDDLAARADDYDTLRADVDDNASQIAALNDLTVLLNQDILNLQDRVSAIEAAQADLVARADFDALGGRVTTVETKVTDLSNRVATLEKYAFTIKPSLSATYYVARANRDMDVDRLLAGTVFSTGDDGDADTSDAPRDYADFTGSRQLVSGERANFYGFSTGNGGVREEGETTIDFSIDFTNSGKFDTTKSATTGAYVTSVGGLNVNKVDIKFGIRAGLPDSDYISAGDYANYPDVVDTDSGITYRPLFFYFSNGTADFTVGNTPITVTFGKALKFKFADYIGDNDKTGRGDGYIVNVDGSNLPVIGSLKPTIQVVYGSRNGNDTAFAPATDSDGNVIPGTNNQSIWQMSDGANQYYRGVRATITPVGTLKAGIHYLQEGQDEAGAALTSYLATTPDKSGTYHDVIAYTDKTAFGADLHGTVAGWQLDSEYARVQTTATLKAAQSGATASVTREDSAFYVKTSGNLGSIAKVYTLNYRTVSGGFSNRAVGINEAYAKDTDNGSTAPYGADRTGFGIKVGTTLGPVALAAYQDNEVAYGNNPFQTADDSSAIVDRGVTGKINLFNLVTVRGGYYEYITGINAPVEDYEGLVGVRYGVRADITPGLGLAIGAYYRNVGLAGNSGPRAQNDGGLFANGKYNSYFDLATNDLKDQSGCGDLHPGIKSTDTDMVGRALTFSQNSFGDSYCYSEYGADLTHDGKDANALVKDLSFRVGYAARYRNYDEAYTNNFFYGDVLYGKKVGIAQVDLKGAFGVDTYSDAERNDTRLVLPPTNVANSKAYAFGIKVKTDELNVAFKPSFEGQFGIYSRSYDYGTFTIDPDNNPLTANNVVNLQDYTADAMKYVVGVKLNEFLLPNTKLAVYYAGYQGKNRVYRNFATATALNGGDAAAGSFRDQNTGVTINQNLVYVEGNYYDLSFGYGYGTLSMRDANGNAVPADAKGSVFKINYKVNF
ncbi:S-layer homology domain-containing protein [Deinococcus kurensis]|uniref:S-layer homology domain-containing protein n=1 Tax=Deinococcus kurensis TaxID=2662757 RepID=UPI0012D35646|nr:S-layer homology domain-containing protein [Deinococcus kurensis]